MTPTHRPQLSSAHHNRKKAMQTSLRIFTLTAIALAAAILMVAQTSQVSALLARARAQEQAGRVDLAAQTWQQVLLVDNRDTEALAGLARAARLAGKAAEADRYLQQLRQIDPKSPQIARIQSTSSTKVQTDQLLQAAKLAQAGQTAEALKLYRSVWGSRPPDGDWALAYYDTEASTETGRPDAVAALRALATKYPGDTRYSVTLGRILTYSPKSRSEGLRLLEKFPQNTAAQQAIRQAHLWDTQNPTAAPEIRAYLKDHPDAQLAQSFDDAEQRTSTLSKANPGIPQTAAEREAFAALAEGKVEDAKERFLAIQNEQPENPRVLAGLGFLRMKQGNFGEAIGLLQQAQANGLHRRDVDVALQTARYWATVQRGTDALTSNHLEEAATSYKAALRLRSDPVDALNGLAGTYLKSGTPAQAVEVYRQLIKLLPTSTDAWRGLFTAQIQANQPDEALETSRRLPPKLKAGLQKDPAFLRDLANAYRSNGQDAEAQAAVEQALALPFPDHGHGVQVEARLQHAQLLIDAKRSAQAAALYREILYDDPESLPAWQGLIALQHQAGRDPEAIETVERMAPSTYNAALDNSDFLILLAGIYQAQNRFDLAQTLLQKAAATYTLKAQPVPLAVQLQMASISLQQNRPEPAYTMYAAILRAHPEQALAWKGLISALHQTHRDRDALAELREIPPLAQKELDRDVAYQQTVAGIYAATGNEQAALQLIAQMRAHDRALQRVTPPDVEIQNAWLLYNTHDDRDLYRTLMALGGREDLADDQRRTVQTLWATWSVRRAGEAVDAGNTKRAVEILTVAYQAFPDNTDVIKALAGGYLKAGDARRSMTLYTTLHLANPTAADFQGMVSAALAAPDLRRAEAWLREALDKFANDPQVLTLAARFEQARGDHTRAAAYLKRSLAAMPPVDPTKRLAHTLDRDDAGPIRRSQDASISSLLDPDQDTRAQRPALPSYNDTYARSFTGPTAAASLYGPDPLLTGTAPVQIDRRSDAATAPAESSPSISTTLDPLDLPSAAEAHRALATRSNPLASTDTTADFAPPDLLSASEPLDNAASQLPRHDLSSQAQAPPTAPVPLLSRDRAAAPNPSLHFLTTPANSGAGNASYFEPQSALQPRNPAPFMLAPQSSLSLLEPEPARLQSGSSDVQLQQQDLPPLRGPWGTPTIVHETDPRTIGEQQLALIDAGFSAWRGGSGYISHRTGTAGLDQLTILEAPFETSATVGGNARLTAVVMPSLLDSGQADGTSTYSLGTSVIGSRPAQQNSAGVGGEVQLATASLSVSAGTTPRGFLVPNVTGRLIIHPASGPLTLNFVRDGVKDSQLSYAGLRDPATISSTYVGNLWGGVVSNAGNLQYSRGDEISGYYVGFGGQYITGLNVQTNHRIDGIAGAYWKILKVPDAAELTLGANFFAMHYAHNLRFFTYGQGGYFSPDVYFLANIPFTINGQYGNNLHYTVAGAIGLQAFQEDSSLYFPTHKYPAASTAANAIGSTGVTANVDRPIAPVRPVSPFIPLPTTPVTPPFNNPSYPSQSVVGGNYDLHAELADHVIDHWYIGGFLSLNNTRDYASQTVGFFIRYMTRPQDFTEGGPTGLFPYQGFRPLLVP